MTCDNIKPGLIKQGFWVNNNHPLTDLTIILMHVINPLVLIKAGGTATEWSGNIHSSIRKKAIRDISLTTGGGGV